MTVSEFIVYVAEMQQTAIEDPDNQLTKELYNSNNIWSNQAVIGYAVDAGKSIGLSESQLNDLFYALLNSLEKMTIIEAENLCADTFF